jgi:hypothetical protein
MKSNTVTRRAFVMRFMSDCGISFSQASKVYNSMCRTFEEGVMAGSKIGIGRVGAITPVWQSPRTCHMHFEVKPGQKVNRGIHRTYNMDGRYTFRFNLYRHFSQTRQLKWLAEFPVAD